MSSDIQTVIHTTAMHAYDQGIKAERRRIIKLLEDRVENWVPNGHIWSGNIIELISEDQND